MQRLIDQEPFLRLLARSSPKRRKFLLKQATKEELTALFEICMNIRKNKINLSHNQLKKLKKHKALIRKLADKKVSLKRKKTLINQKGGAIGTVIGAVSSLVLPLLAKLIK